MFKFLIFFLIANYIPPKVGFDVAGLCSHIGDRLESAGTLNSGLSTLLILAAAEVEPLELRKKEKFNATSH